MDAPSLRTRPRSTPIPVPPRPIKPIAADRSLTERVHEALRNGIVLGQLAPGSLYSVQGLADMLGVSRTPVREALIDLARQGMVRFERNRGIRILETSIHDLEEIFALRLLLEVPATYRAAEQLQEAAVRELRREFEAMQRAAARADEPTLMRHDRRFHAIVLEMSGNRRLAEYVDHLRDLILTRGASTVGRSRELPDIVAEHQAVLEGLEARDAKRAAAAMRAHLIQTGKLLVEQEGGDANALEKSWAGLLGVR